MTKRHPDEVILARWTVDPLKLAEFARQVRDRFGDSPYTPIDLLKQCDKHAREGLEVVCRDDAVFVGEWCLAFLYNEITAVRVRDTWLQFEMEGGAYDIPVPFGPDARAEAERMVATYRRMAAEEAQRARAARQAPTLSNFLLDLAEAHFVWVAFGFFLLVIPAVVLVIGWLRGGLS